MEGLESGYFLQAEDGIRGYDVTGVQTCALPILCSTFGIGDFMRVPWPAARMTAARGWALGVMGEILGESTALQSWGV